MKWFNWTEKISYHESDTFIPNKYRIVTGTKQPYKFYIEEYRLGYDFQKEDLYQQKYIFDKKKILDWYSIKNYSIKNGYEGWFTTTYFDTELEAEQKIRDLIKEAETKFYKDKIKKQEKEFEEKRLNQFIKDHPPREYP